jgi:hypothetical protein
VQDCIIHYRFRSSLKPRAARSPYFWFKTESQIFRRRTWAELLAEWHKLDLSFETGFLDRDEPVKARLDTRQYKRECLLKEMVLVGKDPRKRKI